MLRNISNIKVNGIIKVRAGGGGGVLNVLLETRALGVKINKNKETGIKETNRLSTFYKEKIIACDICITKQEQML